MIKRLTLITIVFALAIMQPVMAADEPGRSLFFSDRQMKEIEDLSGRMNTRPVNDTKIYVGAVFYYSEGDWSLWMQGHIWTPETDRDGLHVIEVTPDLTVHIRLTGLAGSKPKDIVLKPYQTYVIATGKTLEGRH